QQITLITPPPPPPKVDEPPPEPEPEENIPEPEEIMDQTPEPVESAGADLGVDADGSGAGDGFGLVGKKGGRGLLDGSPFAWYEGLMASELQDQLAKIEELKSQEYNFRIKLKVGFDGRVERIEMIRSTGDKAKDKLLLSALNSFSRFSQMPPGKMPSVVDLRITSSI
ncbi:MAG: periplasmic protein TonB, partial [Pseudomonadota bacterium]|nr:periplasmic protein TonB [Pseudomonadota bacterium]